MTRPCSGPLVRGMTRLARRAAAKIVWRAEFRTRDDRREQTAKPLGPTLRVALGCDQLQPDVVARTDKVESLVEVVRNEPLAMIMARVEERHGFGAELALVREFFEMPPRSLPDAA